MESNVCVETKKIAMLQQLLCSYVMWKWMNLYTYAMRVKE